MSEENLKEKPINIIKRLGNKERTRVRDREYVISQHANSFGFQFPIIFL